MRYMFEKNRKPTWFIDRLIYTYSLKMAIQFNTPLLVNGEMVAMNMVEMTQTKHTQQRIR